MRVGVTGHRALRHVDAVADAVGDVLDSLSDGTPLVAVSSLAEGADRIVAEAVLRRGGSLEVILPLAADDYEADFASERSRRAFHDLLAAAKSVSVVAPPAHQSGSDDARGDDRVAAYERAGLAVVEACDVLVALWDGAVARGRGGTAEIVDAARRAGVRVEVVAVEREVSG